MFPRQLKRMTRHMLALLILVVAIPGGFPQSQSEEPLPAACDIDGRAAQRRFYQRGNAPEDLTDDALWRFSDLRAQGIEPSIIEPGLALLAESRTRQSLIIMRNGHIAYEAYYNGSRASDSNNIASVSKSMLSALVGVAIEGGYFQSTDDRIADHLPAHYESLMAPALRRLTLHDMLTMTHGLAWDENEAGRLLNRSGDWVADILRLPLRQAPGASFNYSTGVSHVLSAVLTEAAGMSVCEFAHRFLFEPLGVEVEFWGVDPQGYFTGGHSVSMTAREIARFGQLFLDEGRWAGEQILPGWWVAASTSPQVDIGNNYAGYGYYWWLNQIAGYDMYSALGAGGQILHVIPDFRLVLVTTHGYRGNQRDYVEEAESYQFIWDYLIPAIEGA
ncbi:MAG: serine hydrolase [Chloroflexota bacterium]|nr:serine hydrolase [Chloroflexota bacterium]MDE2945812.1 serine hydrolase [Chloroflexota bacterium]